MIGKKRIKAVYSVYSFGLDASTFATAFETPAAIVVFATSSTVALRRNAVAMNASGEIP